MNKLTRAKQKGQNEATKQRNNETTKRTNKFKTCAHPYWEKDLEKDILLRLLGLLYNKIKQSKKLPTL
jgi:hypothetical protein